MKTRKVYHFSHFVNSVRPGVHFDQYCTLVMLYLFNPLIDSVRCLQHAGGLPGVKKLGLKRFSLGSFSEAPGVFEPDRLKEVIAELAAAAKPWLRTRA